MNRKISVLIVDDQEATRQGLSDVLEFEPHVQVVGVAGDGAEAIQFVSQVQPDVILMDVQMPGMNGLEATQLIKAQWPQVKIIVFTVSPAHELDAHAAGANHFLLKGSVRETVADAIRTLFPAEFTNSHFTSDAAEPEKID